MEMANGSLVKHLNTRSGEIMIAWGKKQPTGLIVGVWRNTNSWQLHSDLMYHRLNTLILASDGSFPHHCIRCKLCPAELFIKNVDPKIEPDAQ